MIENVRHKRYGNTVAEWVPMHVAELESDAVALAAIIADGRDGFGLDGLKLELFVSMRVRALLENDAVPVIGGGEYINIDWVHQPKYGNNADKIIKNVIAEWRASGVDPDLGGLWFALPDAAFPNYVKMD